jgi:hypothetical protein
MFSHSAETVIGIALRSQNRESRSVVKDRGAGISGDSVRETRRSPAAVIAAIDIAVETAMRALHRTVDRIPTLL